MHPDRIVSGALAVRKQMPRQLIEQALDRARQYHHLDRAPQEGPNRHFKPEEPVRFADPFGQRRRMQSGHVVTVWPNGRWLTIQGKELCPWVVDLLRTRVQRDHLRSPA